MNCTILFYNLFLWMEQNDILDIDNEIHMFSLHFVFRDRINSALQKFKTAWNNHPLSSERNLSPLQLWIQGLLANSHVQDNAEVSLDVVYRNAKQTICIF